MVALTLQVISDFCSLQNCQILLGDPEKGFIRVDSGGVQQLNNYHRFLSFGELGEIQLPRRALQEAILFRIEQGSVVRELNREEFEKEIHTFLQRVGTK